MKHKVRRSIILCIFVILTASYGFVHHLNQVDYHEYTTFAFHNEQTGDTLIVKEWSLLFSTGAEFYLNSEETYLGDIMTNETLPFSMGEYAIQWGEKSITIVYLHSDDIWKEETFTLPDT